MKQPNEDILDLRNDFAVALIMLEVLSEDERLPDDLRHLVKIALARQLRAVCRLFGTVPTDCLNHTDQVGE